MRIAVGGIAHETNTFSTLATEYEDFRRVEGPELIEGQDWDRLRSELSPDIELEIIPLFSAHATPSGRVTRGAFERLLKELMDGLEGARPLDGVLLVLHGAMEVEEIGDGETEILRTVRSQFGPDLFIAVTLDLHANLAPQVVEAAQIVTAYRTAPHRDAIETRIRGMRHMVRCLQDGARPVTRMVKLPLLVAGEAAVTEVDPARGLFALLPEIDRTDGVLVSSLLIGCAWTDSIHTGVATVVSGTDDAAVSVAAEKLAESAWEKRHEFTIDSVTAEMAESIELALGQPERPVFISDSGDNTTAGAAGDSPLFLRYCIESGVADVLVAGVTDPDAVSVCERAGQGAVVHVEIGGKLDTIHSDPFSCTGTVLTLKTGEELGPGRKTRTILRIGGVDVVLQTDRRPFTELSHFREMGIDPKDYRAIIVKEGYLFPELRDYAPYHIMALSAGFGEQRFERLPYERLARPIFPLERETSWAPQ
jgi:microcystin degradation protein MlrC